MADPLAPKPSVLVVDRPEGIRTAGAVPGYQCERCGFDTYSRCLRCDVSCCGDCLGRHDCEVA